MLRKNKDSTTRREKPKTGPTIGLTKRNAKDTFVEPSLTMSSQLKHHRRIRQQQNKTLLEICKSKRQDSGGIAPLKKGTN